MKTNLILLVLLLNFPLLIAGQHQQLTSHENFNNYPYYSTHEFQNEAFYVTKNQSEIIEIYQITKDSLYLIFESSLVLCEADINCWAIYEDLIIFNKFDSFIGINFISNEIEFEEEYESTDCFHVHNDILLLDNAQNEVYDVRLKQFVPKIYPVFKSDNHYYAKSGGQQTTKLFKREFYNTELLEIFSDSFHISIEKLENNLFIGEDSDTIAYMINKSDEIITLGEKRASRYNNISSFNDSLIIWSCYDGLSATSYIYNLSSEFFLTKFNIENTEASSVKFAGSTDTSMIILSHSTNLMGYLATTYNLESNIADTQSLIDYDINYVFDIIEIEGIVYFFSLSGTSIFWLDAYSGDLTKVESPQGQFLFPFGLNVEGELFLKIKTETGFQFSVYDINSNMFSELNTIPLNNKGVNTYIRKANDFIWSFEDESIDIYRPEESDGILNLGNNIIFNGKVYENQMYFVKKVLIGNIFNYELRKYDIQTNIEELIYTSESNFGGGKIVDNFFVFNCNNNTIYNLDNGLFESINSSVKELMCFYKKEGFSYKNTDKKLYFIDNFNFEDATLLAEEIEILFTLSENQALYLKDSILHYYNGYEDLNFLTTNNKTFYNSKYSSSLNGAISTISYLENDQYQVITFNKQGEIITSLSTEKKIIDVYSNNNIRIYVSKEVNENSFELILVNLSDGSIYVNDDFNYKGKVVSVLEDEIHLFREDLQEINIFNYELEFMDNYYVSFPLIIKKIYSTINEGLSMNPRPLIVSNTENNGVKKLAILDAKERTLDLITDCDEDLIVSSYLVKDSTVFFVAKNNVLGKQIYSYEIENFTNSLIGERKEKIVTIAPNPVTHILKFDRLLSKVKIMDIVGRKVLEKENCNKINVKSLTAGVYYLTYLIGDKIRAEKFIKTH